MQMYSVQKTTDNLQILKFVSASRVSYEVFRSENTKSVANAYDKVNTEPDNL